MRKVKLRDVVRADVHASACVCACNKMPCTTRNAWSRGSVGAAIVCACSLSGKGLLDAWTEGAQSAAAVAEGQSKLSNNSNDCLHLSTALSAAVGVTSLVASTVWSMKMVRLTVVGGASGTRQGASVVRGARQ